MVSVQKNGSRKLPAGYRQSGQEVQRIGLGYVKAREGQRVHKPSLSLWLGQKLERYGRRLQRRMTASV